MKIGVFITHFPSEEIDEEYSAGGGDRVAYNLVRELSKKDELVVFTTSSNSRDILESKNSIRIFRYGKCFNIGKINISFTLLLMMLWVQ